MLLRLACMEIEHDVSRGVARHGGSLPAQDMGDMNGRFRLLLPCQPMESPLEDGQVSAIRVRWEREKRKAAQASDEPAKKGKKKATKTAKAAKAAEPEPTGEVGKPAKRRRTAAEVAQAEAVAEAERVADALREEALGLTKPVERRDEPMLPSSIEERVTRRKVAQLM